MTACQTQLVYLSPRRISEGQDIAAQGRESGLLTNPVRYGPASAVLLACASVKSCQTPAASLSGAPRAAAIGRRQRQQHAAFQPNSFPGPSAGRMLVSREAQLPAVSLASCAEQARNGSLGSAGPSTEARPQVHYGPGAEALGGNASRRGVAQAAMLRPKSQRATTGAISRWAGSVSGRARPALTR